MGRYTRIAFTQIAHENRSAVTKCRRFPVLFCFKSYFVALVVAHGWNNFCAGLSLYFAVVFPTIIVFGRLAVRIEFTGVVGFDSPRKDEDAVVQPKLGWI